MFERILDLAFTHERELKSQLDWWEDNTGGPYPGRPPVLNPTDELGDLAHQLFAFARQDTADLAQLLHDRLVAVKKNHAFDAGRHVDAAGVVDELAAGAPEAFEEAMEDVDRLRTELIRAMQVGAWPPRSGRQAVWNAVAEANGELD